MKIPIWLVLFIILLAVAAPALLTQLARVGLITGSELIELPVRVGDRLNEAPTPQQ